RSCAKLRAAPPLATSARCNCRNRRRQPESHRPSSADCRARPIGRSSQLRRSRRQVAIPEPHSVGAVETGASANCRFVGPSLVERSLVEGSLVEPSLVEPSLVEPSLVEPSLVEPSLVEPSPGPQPQRSGKLRQALERCFFAES